MSIIASHIIEAHGAPPETHYKYDAAMQPMFTSHKKKNQCVPGVSFIFALCGAAHLTTAHNIKIEELSYRVCNVRLVCLQQNRAKPNADHTVRQLRQAAEMRERTMQNRSHTKTKKSKYTAYKLKFSEY